MNRLQRMIAWFLIPRGLYCDDCPFHSRNWLKESQNNGYCSYMEVGDWEFSHLSLLWDSCKECGKKC